jgi:hypothetical protein
MTTNEVYSALAASGLSVTYYAWKEGAVPDLPYICYFYPETNNFSADDTVYTHVNRLYVELYTKEKDFTTESQVEAVLGDICGFWNKSETYIESESMYQIVYDCEVIINE